MIHKETKTGGCETDEIISPKGKGEKETKEKPKRVANTQK